MQSGALKWSVELQMEPGRSKWSVGNSNGAWGIQMEAGKSKWGLGGANGAWEIQMEPGRFKWNQIESHLIRFKKNDVEM